VAASKAKHLFADDLERLLVKRKQQVWLVQAVVGLIVAIIVVIFMSSLGYLAGILFALGPFLFLSLLTQHESKFAPFRTSELGCHSE